MNTITDPFVSINIMGGLGNQLFQIAMMLYYLKHSKVNRKLVFKNDLILDNKFGLVRKTFWHSLFKHQFLVLDEDFFEMIPYNLYWEHGNHIFNHLPLEFDRNIFFKGYFQSFLYIDDNIRNKMKDYIYSNKDLVSIAKNKYNEIKNLFNYEDDDIISVHFRRTDYIYEENWICNLAENFSYYKDALEIANKKNLIIFSDDIKWCKEYMNKNIYNYDNIYFVEENDVAIEFLLMSMIKHNIIANSTFSLWASFISQQENKIIIAPKNWYDINGAKEWNEIYHKYITHLI
jgi:hypothetical protein